MLFSWQGSSGARYLSCLRLEFIACVYIVYRVGRLIYCLPDEYISCLMDTFRAELQPCEHSEL